MSQLFSGKDTGGRTVWRENRQRLLWREHVLARAQRIKTGAHLPCTKNASRGRGNHRLPVRNTPPRINGRQIHHLQPLHDPPNRPRIHHPRPRRLTTPKKTITPSRRDMPLACFDANGNVSTHWKHAKGMSLRYDA